MIEKLQPDIDHDRLFKELISTFFWEFLQLFLPEVTQYVERDSITFLPQEVFTDVTAGDRRQVDLLAQVKFQGKDVYFIIHTENQSTAESGFEKRMFHYFARLHEKYALPIYPVVVCSYEKPKRPEKSSYNVTFPDRHILSFEYVVIQLNRLNWRDFLQQQNPVAAALMSKMKIEPSDRPKVKAECLRLLATLKLDPARMQLISGFVDTYLRLNALEEINFENELNKMGLVEKETVMEIVTTWMERGLEQGIERGMEQGRQEGIQFGETILILRLLNRRLGSLSPSLETVIRRLSTEQLENLAEALLDFQTETDLVEWLEDH